MSRKVAVVLREKGYGDLERDGDFGVVAIGEHQEDGGPMIEVRFSTANGNDIMYLLATLLSIADEASPQIARDAIKLYLDRREKGSVTKVN